jgi:hypothetical protein
VKVTLAEHKLSLLEDGVVQWDAPAVIDSGGEGQIVVHVAADWGSIDHSLLLGSMQGDNEVIMKLVPMRLGTPAIIT